jgi:hypothetical protein
MGILIIDGSKIHIPVYTHEGDFSGILNTTKKGTSSGEVPEVNYP